MRVVSLTIKGAEIMVVATPKLLTAKEAANSLGISERTLWTLRDRGEISFVKVGGSYRYDPVADIQAYIDRERIPRKDDSPSNSETQAVGA